jgi:hypothetical protein
MEEKICEGDMEGWSNSKAQQHMRWVPWLVHDLKASKSFTSVDHPSKHLVSV